MLKSLRREERSNDEADKFIALKKMRMKKYSGEFDWSVFILAILYTKKRNHTTVPEAGSDFC